MCSFIVLPVDHFQRILEFIITFFKAYIYQLQQSVNLPAFMIILYFCISGEEGKAFFSYLVI